MHYLVVPLAEPVAVRAGDVLGVSLDYRAGAPLSAFVPAVDRIAA